VIATMWMGAGAPVTAAAGGAAGAGYAPIAGGSPELDDGPDDDGGGVGGAGGPGGSGTVVGTVWPGPAESAGQPEVLLVAVVFSAASIFFGIFPTPLFNLAARAAKAFTGLG
jgi:NADH-quinone oxidoreductase subunit N